MNKLGRGVGGGLFGRDVEVGGGVGPFIRGVGLLVFGDGVGFVDIGDFVEGAGCVLGGLGAGVGFGVGFSYHNATFCSLISPPLRSRHTVSPLSGLIELSASGLMRSPFKFVSPFHFSLNL
eukprot:scaffold23165_cov83-Skeletonema_dohrnii-CCMP3373.AAC.1